jgi:1-deoxy-D-xylulose-5-phosphate reductoisomerase
VKRIAILGSTGSIGQQTLKVIGKFPDRFKVVALAGGSNSNLLTKQIKEFQPHMVCLNEQSHIDYAVQSLPMEEIAAHPDVDVVVVATAGKAGLLPTLAAIRKGKQIALANKEILVMAGDFITKEARLCNAQILPIDSEHSAIWQCLNGEQSPPSRIILTASGGPFHHYSPQQLVDITPEEALKHPTWKMGKKVTVDSATLVNKGLEAIEAHWLFSVPLDSIDIIIHRQSIIHSLVEFHDGSIKAQMSSPDMRLPIQYALSYPERFPNTDLLALDLLEIKSLTFEPVNYDKFPCLRIVLKAGKLGGTYPAVLSATDEIAVALFLSGKVSLNKIPELLTETLDMHQVINNPSLEDILAADAWAREVAMDIAQRRILQ